MSRKDSYQEDIQDTPIFFSKTARKISDNTLESFFHSQSTQISKEPSTEAESNPTESSTPLPQAKPIQDFSQKSFNERLKILSSLPVLQFQLPMREIRSRFSSDFCIPSKLQLPTTGEYINSLYSHLLSEHEKQEILDYKEVYFIGDYIKKNHGKVEEEDGSYKAALGDQLAFRFEIKDVLGKGSFGKVFKCFDHKRRMEVGVKVLNKTSRMKILAETEVKVLRKLNESDTDDSKCVVRMLHFFEYRGHICISFELLSMSLYSFVRNHVDGLDMHLVKRISSQILIGLRHIHTNGIIHRDLKLENILLKHQNKTVVKIIDFGSAALFPCPFYSYVQSRFYRAPEVLLGYPHSSKIDIWSFGCTVVEMITGRSLFMGKNQEDQLIKIAMVIGTPPVGLVEKARKKYLEFEKGVYGKGKLEDLIGEEDRVLVNFLQGCLQWDPEVRFSADEALKHPWIKNQGKKDSDLKSSD